MIEIRKSCFEDIEAIVDINIKTWRTTYSNIIDEDFLFKLEDSIEARIKRSKERFKSGNTNETTLVAVENQKVLGFIVFGKARETEAVNINGFLEIYAVYVLKEAQGKGIGKKLIKEASKNHENVLIWALKDNPFVGFYKKLGGRVQYNKVINIGKQELEEVGFVFTSI